jgi:hypothetical protein
MADRWLTRLLATRRRSTCRLSICLGTQDGRWTDSSDTVPTATPSSTKQTATLSAIDSAFALAFALASAFAFGGSVSVLRQIHNGR